MKIRPRSTHSSLSPAEFLAHVGRGDYWVEDLQTYFSDSQINSVYISYACVREIGNWADVSLQEPIVPEVGGFLLGKYCQQASQQYNVSLDTFVKATEVDFSSPILLDFGSQVMIEMDNIQVQDPTMVNVGWFHTHPGHTPFLSEQDLSSHEGFFHKPFQVAIVLDSLTEEYDTGIFSRKSTGQVNNKEDRTEWISWKQLLSQMGNPKNQ